MSSQMGTKIRAESIAKSLAGTQVVANEIAVLPPGYEDYEVKNGVVTLTGDVLSGKATGAQQIAVGVPNVSQVVNKLEVKNQKATSTN